jgi:hypothetical protein
MKRAAILLSVVMCLSGCASMRDVGIGMQTGAAGAAANGSGGIIIAPVLWVTGFALELAGNAGSSEESKKDDPPAQSPEVP